MTEEIKIEQTPTKATPGNMNVEELKAEKTDKKNKKLKDPKIKTVTVSESEELQKKGYKVTAIYIEGGVKKHDLIKED